MKILHEETARLTEYTASSSEHTATIATPLLEERRQLVLIASQPRQHCVTMPLVPLPNRATSRHTHDNTEATNSPLPHNAVASIRHALVRRHLPPRHQRHAIFTFEWRQSCRQP